MNGKYERQNTYELDAFYKSALKMYEWGRSDINSFPNILLVS